MPKVALTHGHLYRRRLRWSLLGCSLLGCSPEMVFSAARSRRFPSTLASALQVGRSNGKLPNRLISHNQDFQLASG